MKQADLHSLMHRIRAGDADAFAALFDMLGKPVFAVAYRITQSKEQAEDITQEIFLRICDAIAYAHHRGIMHGDLKPENIMLGEYMEVYVMDWGLAREIPPEDAPGDAEERGVRHLDKRCV